MKLLVNPTLMQISDAISGETNEARIDCRIESYSCKMIAQEKKMFKSLADFKPEQMEALAPTPSASALTPGILHSLSPSSLSPSVLHGTPMDGTADVLQHTCSARTLYYLKATLNTVFAPDYDFSSAKSHEFSKEPSFDFTRRNLYGHLASAIDAGHVNTVTTALWAELEKEIAPSDCDIYSYNPDGDSDPFGEEGSLWSLNYFIYNKKLKRIVFIRCSGCSTGIPSEDELDEDLDLGPAGDMSEDEMEIIDPPSYTTSSAMGMFGTGRTFPQDLSYME